MAIAKEISVDAAIVAVFSELDVIFKLKEWQKMALGGFLGGRHVFMLLPTLFGKYWLNTTYGGWSRGLVMWLKAPAAPTGSLELVKLAVTNVSGPLKYDELIVHLITLQVLTTHSTRYLNKPICRSSLTLRIKYSRFYYRYIDLQILSFLSEPFRWEKRLLVFCLLPDWRAMHWAGCVWKRHRGRRSASAGCPDAWLPRWQLRDHAG